MRLSPRTVLKLISYWPPYFFSGIRVENISPDVDSITVRLKASPWNKNYFGTHFGGSLYSMCDPFFVFLLSHQLGKDYIIWDRAAEIEFIKAVSETVYAQFEITPEDVVKCKEETQKAYSYHPQFEVEIRTSKGKLIAKVKKTLYVRRKDAKKELFNN